MFRNVGTIRAQRSLAPIGAQKLCLVDHDRVDLTNVTTQCYLHANIGKAKVEATAAAIKAIDPMITLQLIEDRYRPRFDAGEVMLCCVDSISARKAIYRSASV